MVVLGWQCTEWPRRDSRHVIRLQLRPSLGNIILLANPNLYAHDVNDVFQSLTI